MPWARRLAWILVVRPAITSAVCHPLRKPTTCSSTQSSSLQCTAIPCSNCQIRSTATRNKTVSEHPKATSKWQAFTSPTV